MTLFGRVKDWGYRVFILQEPEPDVQIKKLIGEVYELSEAISFGTEEEVKNKIGKCLVILNILSHMTGNTPNDCLRLALDKIEKRKGKMEEKSKWN